MALIKCPECGQDISDKSLSCVHCGYPMPKKPIPQEELSCQENKPLSIGIRIAAFFVVCLILTGSALYPMLSASSKNPLAGQYFSYYVNDYERYTLHFTETTVEVDHSYYNKNPSSPSGMLRDSSKSTEGSYNYTMISGNQFSCEGKNYTFTLVKNGHTSRIVFDSKFQGITKTWN